MNIINLNSRIVNPARTTAAQEQYQLGWDRYVAGEQLSQWASDDERRGWRSAMNAQAYAETSAYLLAHRS